MWCKTQFSECSCVECLTEFTTKLELIQQFSGRNTPISSSTSSKNQYCNGKETKETVSDLTDNICMMFGCLCVSGSSICQVGEGKRLLGQRLR